MATALTFAKTATWAESYTKLLAFNQTDYERILHLDSDSTVLQNMDELFFIEPAFVAMPRAYWLGFQDRILSSQLLLLQPNKYEFDRVMKATSGAGGNDYDMDLLNNLYKDNALVLPHRPYDLLTGEFRGEEHSKYIGDDSKSWDPDYFYKECKFLHFSDWPLPKVRVNTLLLSLPPRNKLTIQCSLGSQQNMPSTKPNLLVAQIQKQIRQHRAVNRKYGLLLTPTIVDGER